MIRKSETQRISIIFNSELDCSYVIPKYQREYSWKREHWEQFMSDIKENEEGYFLGSIILKDTEDRDIQETKKEVIDGQQRLATLSILFAAIFKKMNKLSDQKKEDDSFIAEKTNLKHRLVQKSNSSKPKLKLSSQAKNDQDYQSILHDAGVLTRVNIGNLDKRKLLWKAYHYFMDFLEKEYKEYESLTELLKKLNNALVVTIEVRDNADAFAFFESLNYRGEPLSVMDFAKNMLLSKINDKQLTPDQAFEKWKNIVEDICDPKEQERLLRQFYNAFRYKEKIKLPNYPEVTKSKLIDVYKKIISQDPIFFLDEFEKASKIYAQFLKPEKCDNKSGEIQTLLQDLLHVKSAPAYTFLLYIFYEYSEDIEFIKGVLKLLVKYSVRRNATDFPPTRELDRIFIEIIDKVEEWRKDSQNKLLDQIEKFLTEPKRFSDLKKFRESLEGDIYDPSGLSFFLLAKIDEQAHTKENRKDFWELDQKNRHSWSVDHILPEGENLPDEWIKMIADGDKEEAQKFQELYVHKLGNLTLTAYNSNLSNSPFLEKRDKKDKSNPVGYKNGLHLNKDVKDKESWTIEDIKNRTKRLVSESLKLWQFDNEDEFLDSLPIHALEGKN
ncbi:MAG: DUF262 domain-containing HNH endonuclease family protein [Firmicutes bacterium]|nr:DUF262 domain-containing HNH endonuclease family protein [Bacillota bacterium]